MGAGGHPRQDKDSDMATAQRGDTVKVHYRGTLADGTVFDSSEGREPLEFKIGSGQVIVGFDEAVTGMEPGHKKEVTIPMDKAYGSYNGDLVMTVSIDQVPPDLKPEVGMMLEVGGAGGEIVRVQVVEVTGEHIILDANPPLAGKDLNFSMGLGAIGE